MAKIIGNTTTTPMAIPDWNQTNPAKADYIKNKPEIIGKLSEGENGELLYNGNEIGGGLSEEYAEQIEANTAAKHTHNDNLDVLDKFSEVDGVVFYNSQGISGVYVGSGEMPNGYVIQVDPDENIGFSGLPSVSDEDEGKFLRVVGGQWAVTEIPSAEGVVFE